MSMEQRIRHLLRAANRAENEGDQRTAEILRRMAREALPIEAGRGSVPPPAQLRVS